ncbi:TonB-dependent receptor [Stieleria sp. ICT_E10.1]|uniref:TonB-dependent receptor domain-containing protein n=1 Tax=Stieleria sedimenti TaxID=2976331 RepID=UPI0021804DCC|nr:TonB-dependent receptor [Stieleria sedimenti]MCS7468927.1 TonB-dependent receptor [Stieleria sedimenti]
MGLTEQVTRLEAEHFRSETSPLRQATLLQPTPFLQPANPVLPSPSEPEGRASLASQLFDESSLDRSLLIRSRLMGNSGVFQTVQGSRTETALSTDVGSLLRKSKQVVGVDVQQRSPIISDPRVRSYNTGQLLTKGSDWAAARPDLDSALSKINSRLVDSVRVIRGPYELRYGTEFAGIDSQLLFPAIDEPVGGLATMDYSDNGDQWFSHQRMTTRVGDGRLLLAYSHSGGVDYRSGELLVPSGFKSRDAYAAMVYPLRDDLQLFVNYLHLDQTEVELPGQFFDLDFLGADGGDLRLVWSDDPASHAATLEAWGNRTRFDGAPADDPRGVLPEVEEELGNAFNDPSTTLQASTRGRVVSQGFRVSWMEKFDAVRFETGFDLRSRQRSISEDFLITAPGPPAFDTEIKTNLPRGHVTTTGVYLQGSVDNSCCSTTTVGARLDYVDWAVEAADIRDRSNFRDVTNGAINVDLTRNSRLPALYIIRSTELSSELTVYAASGYSERAPTLVESYADGVFLGLIQSGISRVIGNPSLEDERIIQCDAGVGWQGNRLRWGVDGFYTWAFDYVTFQANPIDVVTGARLLKYINTPEARLLGGNAYVDWRGPAGTHAFANFSYLRGTDESIHQPLGQIAPPSLVWGIRTNRSTSLGEIACEVSVRSVARQYRQGVYRDVLPVVGVLALEDETPGFSTVGLRFDWQPRERLRLVYGVANLFDKFYQEHLDYRTGQGVFQPGRSVYFGAEWTL